MKNRTRKALGVDDLKSIFRASRETGSAGKGPCPLLEEILESFSPDTNEKEKFRVVDHVAACPSCHRKFEAARAILLEANRTAARYEGVGLDQQAGEAFREKARVRIQELEKLRRRPEDERGRGPLRGLLAVRNLRFATAAVLVLIAGLVLISVLTLPHRPEDDMVRGEQAQGIRLEAPRGEWAARSLAFRWASYPGAGEFMVKLLDEELTPVWMSDRTKNSFVALPPERLAGLAKGKTYYWKVIAYLKTGAFMESGLQEFRLKP